MSRTKGCLLCWTPVEEKNVSDQAHIVKSCPSQQVRIVVLLKHSSCCAVRRKHREAASSFLPHCSCLTHSQSKARQRMKRMKEPWTGLLSTWMFQYLQLSPEHSLPPPLPPLPLQDSCCTKLEENTNVTTPQAPQQLQSSLWGRFLTNYFAKTTREEPIVEPLTL